MRRYLILMLVLVVVLLLGAVGAPALPDGVEVNSSGSFIIGGDALAPASMPAEAVEYAASLLGGG